MQIPWYAACRSVENGASPRRASTQYVCSRWCSTARPPVGQLSKVHAVGRAKRRVGRRQRLGKPDERHAGSHRYRRSTGGESPRSTASTSASSTAMLRPRATPSTISRHRIAGSLHFHPVGQKAESRGCAEEAEPPATRLPLSTLDSRFLTSSRKDVSACPRSAMDYSGSSRPTEDADHRGRDLACAFSCSVM